MIWEQDFQDFIVNELEKSIRGKEQQTLNQLSRIENDCFVSSHDDSEKFVKCMTDLMKKLEKEERKFEFRMSFFQAKTAECFKNQHGDQQGIQKCKEDAKINLDKFSQEFLNNIKEANL